MEFSDNFRRSLHFVFGNEGGLSNHPADKGGLTMMGITSGTLAAANKQGIVSCKDIRKLTREEAAEIYEVNYWERSHANDMPWPLCCLHFDAAVNSGPGQSIKWLQQAVGVEPDGVIGAETLRALSVYNGRTLQDLTLALIERRLAFLRGLSKWRTFGRGWSRRIAALREVVTT